MRLAHADTDCTGSRVRDYLLVMLMFTDMLCTFPVWKVSRISSRRNRLCAVCGYTRRVCLDSYCDETTIALICGDVMSTIAAQEA